MGKKGSWFSAIKRLCSSNSKKKPEAEKKGVKHGGGNRSFIPLFREPSSIEKILGEVDQQNLFIAHPHPHPALSQPAEAQPQQVSEEPQSPPPPPPPRAAATPPPPRAAASPPPSRAAATPPPTRAAASPPPPRAAASPPPRVVHRQTEIDYTVQQRHLSATRIQAAYRGYMIRRKVRGVTGLVRLQGVVKGQHVKRQTVNAMKQMQLLVRLQTQIQSRRMQTIEDQALKRKPQTSELGNSNNQSEMGDEDWDDSLVTKEEREARLQRKMEALSKREKAMAYAYSHQLWKKGTTPKPAQNTLMGYPWWWNWLDRQQLPSNSHPANTPSHHRQRQAVESPVRPSSSRSTMKMKFSSKPRGASASPTYPMKDDDSLMSCPPFSVPHYMSPTASAKAKARPTSNPKDRMPGTPGSVSSQRRRLSFPVTPNSTGHHKSPRSVGDFSVDSAFSIGRKPFNRFV